MVNEASIIELFGQPKGVPRNRLVLDTNAIEKGAFLELLDENRVSGANVIAQPCAGIASMEKVASDGSTTMSSWTQGIFNVLASGAIVMGAPLVMAASNKVSAALPNQSGAQLIGYSEATAANAETFRMRLDL